MIIIIKKNPIYITIFIVFLSACHPFYRRLTNGDWEEYTTKVRYPDLPLRMQDTIKKYYESPFTADTLDDFSDLISLDSARKFIDIAYYDAYSKKFRIPFGRYFKIGKKKYFINYSNLRTPLIYYDNYLFFSSGLFFEELTKSEKYNDKNNTWYRKLYYFKYKL